MPIKLEIEDTNKDNRLKNIVQIFKNNSMIFFLSCFIFFIAVLNYFIPGKLIIINLYFFPVMIAAYFIGRLYAYLSAFISIIIVGIFVFYYPKFFVSSSIISIYIYLFFWAVILITIGALISRLKEDINVEIKKYSILGSLLNKKKEELEQAEKSIRFYEKEIDEKVKQRTDELERKNEDLSESKEKLKEVLNKIMDPTVAKLMIEGRLLNEKRNISIMFSDLVGFTSYSEERSPELVISDLNRYFNEMESIIISYHGMIDKFIGDGIMCEFGTPLDYIQYRLIAVLCALKMQQKMQKCTFPWQMRIGIASGPTITGIMGSRRHAYTAIGDVVNLSSRLEKECPPGSLLIDETTLEGIKQFFDFKVKKRISSADSADRWVEEDIDSLYQKLNSAEGDLQKALILYEIGRRYSTLGEYTEASTCFEKALQLRPDNMKLKVAFAEAAVKKDKYNKIEVKGRKKRVTAYEILGLKNILLDREKMPESFYNKYGCIINEIDISEDVILPVEALDGCIGHSKVVAIISYALASVLNLPEKDTQDIVKAAFLADIGKEIVSHHLLNRPDSSLSESEIREVQSHSVESVRILREMGIDSAVVLQIIRNSHERFNGTGYPDRLKCEDIPIGSRIIAVADTYDALTSWRPYRERWNKKAAFEELKRGVQNGTFDPKIVEIAINILEK
ncbi:MAG: HD domain-containing protein [Desulfobacterales bacterium]|nr:HD domain-containing protein [Desulfobacterales bacterium]